MWYGDAKKYVQWKDGLAQELSLHMFANELKGSKIKVEDKIARQQLPLTKTLVLNVSFYRKDKSRCDIDNLLKMVMDLLQTARIIYNDDQIREVNAKMFKADPNPRFEFEII